MAGGQDVNHLLERIFLKFGSADTDAQFEAAVNKFLPPVLLQLKSSEEGIRKKVLEMLVHVNKRLKSRSVVSSSSRHSARNSSRRCFGKNDVK